MTAVTQQQFPRLIASRSDSTGQLLRRHTTTPRPKTHWVHSTDGHGKARQDGEGVDVKSCRLPGELASGSSQRAPTSPCRER